ncbi:MAG: NADH-quinone oxidoreductase subunit L [Chloroflexi bacterium]|nr:MAG: NADH-quinone oxidoreductase subunit L [Chloroflexota bacterium]MBL1197108.1 NADH-quinone oxidoreductase subunit L [Chloroflexota bacterium]NOH14403.1 NADH-quinone oxidoreductase subunit L [Chloroflexota bacterium]
MNPELLIWLIPLPPLLAFGVITLFTNRSNAASSWVGVGSAFISWVLGLLVFIQAIGIDHFGEHPFGSSVEWLPLGSGAFSIGVLVDPLTAVMLFFVTTTVLMIFIYSVGYHNYGQPKGDHDQKGLPPHGATVEHGDHSHTVPSVEPMYARFFAFIGLFAFGMFTLVVSDNLLTLFVGWEIMGLCSYLLIGFWYAKPSARDAAKKAFMTTRVGDVFMLLGIAYLYTETGTLNFRNILYNQEVLDTLAANPAIGGFWGLSAAGLIGLLLFIGTVGKSAQFPLHVWLPDAMEGPTPVSAMIHAATMVSAGVYMVVRMFPILALDEKTLGTMAVIGAFTALMAATIAVAQNDVKRVLAYSTISQLGFMVAALGIGAYIAAAFHLVTHAFFKALLFLGSGSVIHGMEHGVLHTGNHKVDPQDMFNMGGLRKKMPITFWTFLIGGFALSGFPLVTAGFWSKDEILADAWGHHHYVVFWVLAIAALLTAFYTGRQLMLTFGGEARTEEAKHAHESVPSMTWPLMILSFFAITAGWVGIPEKIPVIGGLLPNWFHDFVGGTLLKHPEALSSFDPIPLITSVIVALGGLSLGWLVYRNIKAGDEDPLKKPLGEIYGYIQNKWYWDEIYNGIFVHLANLLSEPFTYRFLDRTVIDGSLHWIAQRAFGLGGWFRDKIDGPIVNGFGDFVGSFTNRFGHVMRYVQTGRVQQYMIWAALVAFGGLFYFLAFVSTP